ncbi:hypothetical protein MMC21_007017 [Puttea exsequens]|nr:hypothetical protein [Puttea exsequens]
MSLDPISAVATGFNSTIKILELTFQLKAVGEQTTDLLRTTEHVNRNVNEARRLRRLKASWISADDRAWMDETIRDCEKALQEVQQLIEPARVDAATTQSINPKNRVFWVFRDGPRVRDKHTRLSTCHQTLNTVIGVLHAKDVVVVAPLPSESRLEEPPPYTQDLEAMFNRRSHRRNKKSFTNLKGNEASPFSTFSMSDPSTPIPHSPGELLSSSKDGQRPSLVSSFSDGMSAKSTPSAFYCSYDGLDDLQVFDSGSHNLLAQDVSSPVPFPQNVDNLSHTMAPSHMSDPPAPSKTFDRRGQTHEHEHDLGFPASTGPTTNAEGAAKSTRPFARTKGREWMARYAAESDRGHNYDDSHGYG